MRVLIVGAGVMGRGIAGLCALSGHETLVFDADPDAQRHVRASIEGSWARARFYRWEGDKAHPADSKRKRA